MADANTRLAFKLLGIVVLSVLFAFGLVPFYNLLCQVTGFNGKAEAKAGAVSRKVDSSRWVTVEFTGTVMPGLPWELKPAQVRMKVHPGEINLTTYVAHNVGNERTTGQAVPSVSPGQASRYFEKVQCFCFQQQPLQPGETREMPVTFIVGADLPPDVSTITLSYAFFKAVKQN